ncbi:RDD family protein [Maricaulis sp.]|uniref:RDD family protein n=1 Tax=Maricaulis sp. TaxID=1486257 RepID=UPI002B274476|nr:RDD family protein [Maricaulis sp.]
MAIKRILAFLADYIVIAAYIGLLILVNYSNAPSDLAVPTEASGKIAGHAIGFVTLTLPVFLYFTVFEASPWAATPGKKLLGVRIVATNGERLSRGRVAIRNAIKLLPWELAHAAIWHVPGRPLLDPMPMPNLTLAMASNLAVALFILMLFFGGGRTLYDRISGTHVISARRP